MNQNSNNNGFTYTNGMSSQTKHPFTKAPGSEFQQMNYKDWLQMDTVGAPMALSTNNQARNGVIIATGIGWATLGFIPVAGPVLSAAAGILNVILPFLWPEDDAGSSQITWEQLMNTVEGLVDERILASKRSDATARLQGIQTLTRDYRQALNDLKANPNNELKKNRVRDTFDDVEDAFKLAMPFCRAQGFEVQMLAMYVQAANMHLLLLRDVVQHGTSWGFQQYEIDRYYSNTNGVGNPGMLQLLAQYTDHCVRWYNIGLENSKATNDWNKFNDFRRDMTIMVLDIISLWPTYDPTHYAVPTKSQFTRTVHSTAFGRPEDHTFAQVESNVIASPRLFTWLREMNFHSTPFVDLGYTTFCGVRTHYQYTLNDNIITGELQGRYGALNPTNITIPSPQNNDDIRLIRTAQGRIRATSGPARHNVSHFQFEFAKSNPQTATTNPGAYPHWSETVLPYIDQNSNLYSHRFSHMGIGLGSGLQDLFYELVPIYYTYGWTHVSADHNNLIDAQKITQIPAVKASSISGGARVVKGPGSTGGDLVEISLATGGRIQCKVTLADITKSYKIRIRYAYGSNSKSADTLSYTDFSYSDSDILTSESTEATYIHDLNPSDFEGLEGKFFFDKFEFIPM